MLLNSFACPHSAKQLKSTDGVEEGKTLRCPGCKKTFKAAAADSADDRPRKIKKKDEEKQEVAKSSPTVFWIRAVAGVAAIVILAFAGYIVYQKRFVGIVVDAPLEGGSSSRRTGEGAGPANPGVK